MTEIFKKYNRPPLSPEEAANKITSETMERQLIFGVLRSYLFYREVRDILCPYTAETGTYRPDFTIQRYNVLYRAADAYWRYTLPDTTDTEFSAAMEGVMAYVTDWRNARAVDDAIYQTLVQEIVVDAGLLEQTTLEASRELVKRLEFKKWIGQRQVVNELAQLQALKDQGKLTPDQLKARVANLGNAEGYQSNYRNAGVLLRGTRSYTRVWKCSLPELNALTAGGFRKPSAWIVAALTGCGKTIFANQIAWDFAKYGANVVIVTTEQRPEVLIPRIVSNVTSTDFGVFINGQDLDFSDIEKTKVVPNIPPEVWKEDYLKTNPELTSMADIEKTLTARLKYVDWTGGNKRSVRDHLKPEIDAMRKNENWIPDVIIFDWLGGALEGIDTPEKVRFIYKKAADEFAVYCQANDYLGFMLAQLAQGLALNKQVVQINMLAEAKNIVDRFDGFIGISGMHASEKSIDESTASKPKLNRIQFMHMAKTRDGEGGVCSIIQDFRYQRFKTRTGAKGTGSD